MTMCITLDGKIINVGPWDYRDKIEVFNEDDYPKGYGEVIDGFWIQNPLPAGAVTEDITLMLTAEGSFVRRGG